MPVLLVAFAFVLAAPAGALWSWGRLPGGPVPRAVQRLLLIMVCQLSAVTLAAILINRTGQFYESWSELLGRPSDEPVSALDDPLATSNRVRQRFAAGDARTRSVLDSRTVLGPRSALKAQVKVYLPPQYNDPAYASTRFPVVQLLSGFPGTPSAWVSMLRGPERMNAAVAAGRSQPFVLVIPQLNFTGPRLNTECSDVVGGPRVETWLTEDVRELVLKNYRVSARRSGWGVLGFSTGGFCATKLAMRRPDLFSAAVGMSGNFSLSRSAVDDLFGGDRGLAAANSPSWLVRHRRPPDVALRLSTSAGDGSSARELLAFAAQVRPPTRVDTVILPRGGHNVRVWSAQLPSSFGWLTRQLHSARGAGPPGAVSRPAGAGR
jgi:S-formylglutathione hydrolase FrmB